jgi:hypothetical protein
MMRLPVRENLSPPPDVIAGQMNVFPAERRELLQQGVIDGLATIRDGLNRPLQIHGIP